MITNKEDAKEATLTHEHFCMKKKRGNEKDVEYNEAEKRIECWLEKSIWLVD